MKRSKSEDMRIYDWISEVSPLSSKSDIEKWSNLLNKQGFYVVGDLCCGEFVLLQLSKLGLPLSIINKIDKLSKKDDENLRDSHEKLKNSFLKTTTELEELKESFKKTTTELEELKRNSQFDVPSAVSIACKTHPPSSVWKFNFNVLDASEAWSKVSDFNFVISQEEEMMDEFKKILQTFGFPLYAERSKNRKNSETVTYPDYIFYSDTLDKFDPKKKAHRKFVQLDIDIKRRFKNTRKLNAGKVPDYPTNMYDSYHQMLNRVKAALDVGLREYYYAVTDLEKIIFYKISATETGYCIQPAGPYQLGCSWETLKKKKNNRRRYKVSLTKNGETPEGFSLLYSLVHWLKKGGDSPSLIISNEIIVKSFRVSSPLGNGLKSFIFASQYDDKPCCIKLEPEDFCDQVRNEIQVLTRLNGCRGVPRLLYYGQTYYKGMNWIGIVTDVVGEYSLLDLVREKGFLNELEVYEIGKKALAIIQSIHSSGFIYGDLKPEHFVFYQDELYLIDYGAATHPGQNCHYYTSMYSSIAVNTGLELDFYSDIESLWFVMLSLCEPLKWISTESAIEIIDLKCKSVPKQKKKDYPLLVSLFNQSHKNVPTTEQVSDRRALT